MSLDLKCGKYPDSLLVGLEANIKVLYGHRSRWLLLRSAGVQRRSSRVLPILILIVLCLQGTKSSAYGASP